MGFLRKLRESKLKNWKLNLFLYIGFFQAVVNIPTGIMALSDRGVAGEMRYLLMIGIVLNVIFLFFMLFLLRKNTEGKLIATIAVAFLLAGCIGPVNESRSEAASACADCPSSITWNNTTMNLATTGELAGGMRIMRERTIHFANDCQIGHYIMGFYWEPVNPSASHLQVWIDRTTQIEVESGDLHQGPIEKSVLQLAASVGQEGRPASGLPNQTLRISLMEEYDCSRG